MTEEEEIEKCLNCTKPRCTNCLHSSKREEVIIKVEGKEKTIDEMAEECGVTVSAWRNCRWRNNWDDATVYRHYKANPPRKKDRYLVHYKGKVLTIPEAVKILGVKEGTFRYYMHQKQWDADKVFKWMEGGKDEKNL